MLLKRQVTAWQNILVFLVFILNSVEAQAEQKSVKVDRQRVIKSIQKTGCFFKAKVIKGNL